MPIIVEKGSSLHPPHPDKTMTNRETNHQSHQSLPPSHHHCHRTDIPPDVSLITYHHLTKLEDMVDVLHLNVYVANNTESIDYDGINLSKQSHEKSVRLIGKDLYYNESSQPETVISDIKMSTEPISNTPTLIQRLKGLKKQYTNHITTDKTKDFLTIINESNQSVKTIKAGKQIEVRTEPHSLNETLEWSMKNAKYNELNLISELEKLEEDIRQFHQNLSSKSQSQSQPFKSSTTTTTNHHHHHRSPENRKSLFSRSGRGVLDKVGSLATQLDRMALQNTESFLSAITIDPNPQNNVSIHTNKRNSVLKTSDHATPTSIPSQLSSSPLALLSSSFLSTQNNTNRGTRNSIVSSSIAQDDSDPKLSSSHSILPIIKLSDNTDNRDNTDHRNYKQESSHLNKIDGSKQNENEIEKDKDTRRMTQKVLFQTLEDNTNNNQQDVYMETKKSLNAYSGTIPIPSTRSRPSSSRPILSSTSTPLQLNKIPTRPSSSRPSYSSSISETTRSQSHNHNYDMNSKRTSIVSSNRTSMSVTQSDRRKSSASKKFHNLSQNNKGYDILHELQQGTIGMDSLDDSLFDVNFMQTVYDHFQKSMHGTLEEIQRRSKLVEELQQRADKLLKKSNQLGNQMLNQYKDFHSKYFYHKQNVMKIVEDKEFLYDRQYAMKKEYIDKKVNHSTSVAHHNACETSHNISHQSNKIKLNNLTTNATISKVHPQGNPDSAPAYGSDGISVMKSLESHIEKRNIYTKLKNISSIHWFYTILCKLKEYHHRMGGLGSRTSSHSHSSSNIPMSLYRILSVYSSLFMLGYDIEEIMTKEKFYHILEHTIDSLDDYRNITMHKILCMLREVLSIGHNEFLKYLEDHSIHPCPELLVQAKFEKRDQKRKRHKRNSSIHNKDRDINIDSNSNNNKNRGKSVRKSIPSITNNSIMISSGLDRIGEDITYRKSVGTNNQNITKRTILLDMQFPNSSHPVSQRSGRSPMSNRSYGTGTDYQSEEDETSSVFSESESEYDMI